MNKKALSILFCAVFAVFGVLLMVLGFKEAAVAEGDDIPFTHMILTIPGIASVFAGFGCLLRKKSRSAVRFCSSAFFFLFFGTFLVECIYFQFIHFGTDRPQPKLTIPAAGTSFVYALLFLILYIVFCVIYKKRKA